MKIAIVNSDPNHPINPYLEKFINELNVQHDVEFTRSQFDVSGGDILFLFSCTEKIENNTLIKFDHAFVLHASDLPKGRGWSPHIWQILEGKTEITLSLIEVSEQIDSGRIAAQKKIEIPRSALWNEINDLLFLAQINLAKFSISNIDKLHFKEQNPDIVPSYYRKRKPSDSELSIDKTILDQFNLIRVCDPERFPAFFEICGVRYKVIIKKFEDG